MQDNFSIQSDEYAKFRPTYPTNFFDYLNSIIPNKENAWDCGAGSGQVAYELAKTFDNVYATDISQSQIDKLVSLNDRPRYFRQYKVPEYKKKQWLTIPKKT